MERFFEEAVRKIFTEPPKIEGPKESVSMPAPSADQRPVQESLPSRLNSRASERSLKVSGSMKRIGK